MCVFLNFISIHPIWLYTPNEVIYLFTIRPVDQTSLLVLSNEWVFKCLCCADHNNERGIFLTCRHEENCVHEPQATLIYAYQILSTEYIGLVTIFSLKLWLAVKQGITKQNNLLYHSSGWSLNCTRKGNAMISIRQLCFPICYNLFFSFKGWRVL